MKQGFTLIELMVTVIIIGILSTVALPQYTRAVNKARLAEAVTNLGSLQKAVDMYRIQNRTAAATFLSSGGTRLNIDFKGRLSCSVSSGCSSKFFTYTASCEDSGSCTVTVAPVSTHKWKDYLPTLTATRTVSGLRATWSRTCTNASKDTTMCKSLRDAGFTVAAAE